MQALAQAQEPESVQLVSEQELAEKAEEPAEKAEVPAEQEPAEEAEPEQTLCSKKTTKTTN